MGLGWWGGWELENLSRFFGLYFFPIYYIYFFSIYSIYFIYIFSRDALRKINSKQGLKHTITFSSPPLLLMKNVKTNNTLKAQSG